MYRGRPPFRGPPPSHGPDPRDPHPSHPHSGPDRPYSRPPYRDDRERGRNGYHSYRDHSDTYRRSSPHRRYSPGSGRGPGDDWGGGPPPRDHYNQRRTPSPPRGGLPVDHSLVITVGNDLTSAPGSRGQESYVRDYRGGDPLYKPTRRPSYEGPNDRGPRRRSTSRGRSRSPDRSRARSRAQSRARSRMRSRSRSMDRSRGRSKSRMRSRSRSRSRSRGRSRARSRAHSRARSRARSKSRPGSRSRSRSRSRGRSRSRSRSRGPSRARSRLRSRSRSRSRSHSRSRSSSGGSRRLKTSKDDFQELERARRRKELEDIMNMPTKSILKRRMDSSETDSPIVMQNSDSPRDPEQILTAISSSGLDPALLMSVLGELKDGPGITPNAASSGAFEEILTRLNPAGGAMFPGESGQGDGGEGLNKLLGLLEEMAGGKKEDRKKSLTEIEDEEKFLYGEEDEEMEKAPSSAAMDMFAEGRPEAPPPYVAANPALVSPAYLPSHSEALPPPPQPLHSHSQPRLQKHQSPSPERSGRSRERRERREQRSPEQYPPGVGPDDVKDRQEVEEYEKIQDLLKTIGLDLGVTEISKIATRTKERLQGNKPPPRRRSPGRPQKSKKDRRRRRGSSDSGSSSSSSSSSSSRSSRSSSQSSASSRNSNSWRRRHRQDHTPPSERCGSSGRSQGRKPSPPKEERPRGHPATTKSTTSGQAPEMQEAPQSIPRLGGHQMHQVPVYPPSQAHRMPHPNYPPPGYDQYGNYVPYMGQSWPMYPPPPMGPGMMPLAAPAHGEYSSPYLKVIETVPAEGNEAKKQDKKSLNVERLERGKDVSKDVYGQDRVDEQKEKVLEERDKLRKDRETRLKKKDYLLKELERLRKQQGELLRKKRREKDGHKDPLLMELSRLQEDVMAQISSLRSENEEAEKKLAELEKVALILGLHASDRPRRETRPLGEPAPQPAQEEKHQGRVRSRERSPVRQASSSFASTSKTPASTSKATTETPKVQASAPAREKSVDQFEYYDAGNHWCRNCNVTCGAMFDFFTHLHSKSHRKSQDPYDRPWAADSPSASTEKKRSAGEKIAKPAKGSEFLVAVRGFYCQVCKEFFGDPICAEEHVTSHAHNEKYKQRMYENPLYEQRRNLDRQAGMAMSSETKHSEQKCKQEGELSREEFLKRSNSKEEPRPIKQKEDEMNLRYVREEEKKPTYSREEEDGKFKYSRREEKEEKSKHSKREEDEERSRYGRRVEEEEEKPKYSRREEEEVRPKNMKKDEDDSKFKYSKKDEGEGRAKYRDEEETRFKYSKRAEEDSRGKYNKGEEERNRYAREEDERASYSRADNRSKYGRAEKRSRYGPEEPDRKLKHGKWEEEEEDTKPKWTRDERSQKKERSYRQKQEKGGKKGEVAKEEKPEAPEKPVEPPKVICGPSPAMLAKLRKKNEEANKGGTFGKFTWKKPQKSQLEKEAERMAAQFIKEDEEAAKAAETLLTKEPGGEEDSDEAFLRSLAAAKTIAIKLAGKAATPPPAPAPWQPVGVAPSAMVLRKSQAATTGPVPAPLMKPSSVTPVKAQPPAPAKDEKDAVLSADMISKAFGGEEVKLNLPPPSDPASTVVSDPLLAPHPATKMQQPAMATPAPPPEPAPAPESLPGVCVMSLVADVAVPGVDEWDQTHTVVVRPPPMVPKPPTSKALPKLAKPKSSLAAAKAKDLFDIFYSGAPTATPSTGFRPAQEAKAETKVDKVEAISETKEVIKEPVQLDTDKPKQAVAMDPVQTESVAPIQEVAMIPMQLETVTPIQEVFMDPVQLETIAPIQEVVMDPVQSETVAPIQEVVMDPVQSETVALLQEVPMDPIRSETVALLQEVAMETAQPETVVAIQEIAMDPVQLGSDDSLPQVVMESVHSETDNPITEVVMDTVGLEPDDPSAEDAMAIILGSSSPPPGSFTEQLNLDTFEFNFEPPE